jgi:hypothetical protein
MHFRYSMVAGAFRRFDHDHYFEALSADQTRIRDIFDYTSPFGLIGRLADHLFLESYMRDLIIYRNAVIKHLTELGR